MDEQEFSFRVATDDLSSAVSWVARYLPTNATQPELKGMMFKATDDGLVISGYDYEISTEVSLAAEVASPGAVIVAGKLVASITGSLPSDSLVEFVVDGSKVVISCGKSRFELPIIELDNYPQLPELPKDTGTINPKLFAQAVSQVAVAAGKDDTIPSLTGIHCEIDGTNMVLAATDRYRLAVRSFEWTPEDPSVAGQFLIPAKTLLDGAKTLDSLVATDIAIALGDAETVGSSRLLGMRADNRKTTTRLLDAEFPKFRPLLPKFNKTIASVNIDALQAAVRRVSLVADKNPQICMTFDNEVLTLSAGGIGGTSSGSAEEVIDCAYSGEPIVTAFSTGYLKDGLSAIHSERVMFGFRSATDPAVLTAEPADIPEANDKGVFPAIDSDFTYVLMPVRVPA